MKDFLQSRRRFLKAAALSTSAVLVQPLVGLSQAQVLTSGCETSEPTPADHTIRIKVSPIEIARNRIISTTNYNGQIPGPLIRLKEGQPVTIDIFNHTDVPEQLHWHGQMVPVDVDGAAEGGTPYIPAHGKRRITFTPRRRNLLRHPLTVVRRTLQQTAVGRQKVPRNPFRMVGRDSEP
jgi:FtsP/CotA-like multicopper oxidase with cupredoxin domain